jgi:predicted ribosome quality control (RQC) complex YloA/Tae2 family protein
VQLARALAPLVKRQRRLVANIEGDLTRAGGAAGLAHQGELLKANLARVRKGMPSVTVDDVISGPGDGGECAAVVIELEPSLSPVENLERLFARARKARRALDVAAGRLAAARERLERLERWREQLDGATDEALEEIARALGRAAPAPPGAPPRRAGPERHLPHRTYRDARGRRILVGKSAADNDTLTTRIARPGDLWLHARGYPGSHVVVPLERGAQIDPELLLDAATLAAHFSEARGNPAVEVTYAPRRYVQKPRGAAPGAVTLLREKVLLLAVEPERLARLLRAQIDVDPDVFPK